MAEIQYRFAEDEMGNKIDINDVTQEMQKTMKFFCKICHEPMSAVINVDENKQKFFRHKVTNPNCSKETYLHLIAKEILKERFCKNAEFNIFIYQKHICDLLPSCKNMEDKTNCYVERLDSFDLKKWYSKCVLEKKDKKSGLIPDLMLIDESGVHPNIWLEIFVTHPCTQDKLERGSRIIEFKIDSEEQAISLENIKIEETQNRDIINETALSIYFHNFKKVSAKSVDIKQPNVSHISFELLSSGYIKRHVYSCRENWEVMSTDALAYIDRADFSNDIFFSHFARKIFASYGIGNFKHCNWCKHKRVSYVGRPICFFYKSLQISPNPDSNEAYFCKRYTPIFENIDGTIKIKEGLTLQDLQKKMKDKPRTPDRPIYKIQEKEIIKYEPALHQDEPQKVYDIFISTQNFSKLANSIGVNSDFWKNPQKVDNTSYTNSNTPNEKITQINLESFCRFNYQTDGIYKEWQMNVQRFLKKWIEKNLENNFGKKERESITDDEIRESLKQYLKSQFISNIFGGEEDFDIWYQSALIGRV